MSDSHLLDRLSRDFAGAQVFMTGSGTTALAVALEAIGVEGRRVLIPALTCPNVAIAVLAAGGRPVAVDVSPLDYTLDPASVADALDEQTAAIMAVDPFGYPADLEALKRVVAGTGVAVIEDACQAYGGRVDGTMLGARGSLGAISFGYSKPLALEGGGLLITTDPAYGAAIQALLNRPGFSRLREIRNRLALRLMKAGFNRSLAFLAGRLRLFHYGIPPKTRDMLPVAWDRFMDARSAVVANLRRVAAAVAALPGVRTFAYRDDDWMPWRYSFLLPEQPDLATALLRRLDNHGIRTTQLYRPVVDVLPLQPGPPVPGADSLVHRTANLVYRTTPEATAHLAERLERLVSGERRIP